METRRFAAFAACLVGLGGLSSAALAAPITFNTALPVAEGEFVFREQFFFIKSSDDPSPANRDLEVIGKDFVRGEGLRAELEEVADRIEVRTGTSVLGVWEGCEVLVASDEGSSVIRAEQLILATGAYERPVPFPGWTLPGVMTAGGAQTLVKTMRIRPGRRALVAGTGPLILSLAHRLDESGVEVVAVLEAGNLPWSRVRPPRSTADAWKIGEAVSMTTNHLSLPAVRRRRFLGSMAGLGLAATASAPGLWAAPATIGRRLRAAPARVNLVGERWPMTEVWCYAGTVPGPELRVRQGGRLRVVVENGLAEETTVHWHGLRVPNAMDGVPHLTQPPIAPGASFVYEFEVSDAGTYWYHPHQRSFEQVGRGLYGPLIVEERAPLQVDRDVTWMLDDWRLLPDAQISDDFGGFMDASHNGRVGNTVTLNGRIPETFPVRAGERVRLRLINAANARIFGLEFQGHEPRVIALDGQPVEPHAPAGGRVVLGPAMRADLVFDMAGSPGDRFTVVDTFYQGLEYRLLDLVYEDTPPLRERPLDVPLRLAANTMPEPDPATAERHEVTFGGGMMGGMMMAMMDGRRTDMPEMRHSGMAWAINGIVASGHVMAPLLTLRRGRSYVLAMHNDTAWHHPIHLHGHAFRVMARNGQRTRHREWQDTVLMNPRERVDIAFVADNPGDWMFHCHILEHQAAGMMGVIRVA